MAHMKCKALRSDLISVHSLADVEVVVTKLHNGGKFLKYPLQEVSNILKCSYFHTLSGDENLRFDPCVQHLQ